MKKTDLSFLPTNTEHRDRITDDCLALYDDTSESWMTYGYLRARIETAAAVFETKERGVVLCSLPRSIEGVIAYLAAAHAGHAIILSNPDNEKFEDLIETYKPEWVVSSQSINSKTYTSSDWSLKTLSLFANRSTHSEVHPELYLMLLTSGTTGNSKAVRLSYKNLESNTDAIVKSLNLSSDSTALGHLPLSYSFGLSVLHMQLAVGGRCILSDETMMSSGLWKMAKEQEATLFAGVPYQYEMLMRLGLYRLDVPSMTCFIQAGGKMQKPMVERLYNEISKRQNGELHVMYGQTEASPRMTSLPIHLHTDKIGSTGKVLEGGSATIEDGELYYQGPNIMMGYAKTREELENGDDTGGILKTGDMAVIDEDGFITITGRKQRFAKLFGQRISLDDLEKIASAHGFAVAVEGIEKAVIFARKQGEEICAQIKADIIDQTQMQPAWVEVRSIDDIPHKFNGKIDYEKIQTLAE